MKLLPLALTLLLGACSTLPEAPAELPRQADALSFSGKLNVQSKQDGKSQSDSANFDLNGTPRAGQLELTSPLGTLVARARWQPGLVRLQMRGEERRYADLDEMSSEMLGEPIPVAALFAWLKGQPVAEMPSEAIENGFVQLGWQIDLSRFDATGLIVARRTGPSEVVLRARIERE